MFEDVYLSGTFLFWLGAIFGSFGNVVIYRYPLGESVVRPRSRCQKCKKPVASFDNIPIVSWFVLLGRCRHCKEKISFRYPLVEFITGSLFLALFLKFGWSWTLLELCIFAWALVVACFIDLDHMILPNIFTLSGIVLGLAGGFLNPERAWLDSVYGFLLGGGSLWAVAYIYYIWRKQDGMGGGDIKLLAWMGALLGWKAVPFVIISSSLVGSVVGVLLALRSGSLKTAIPFGPYLGFGALAYIFAGQEITLWYLRFFFPWM